MVITKYLLLLILSLFDTYENFLINSSEPKCQPIKIKECKALGYNASRPIDIYSLTSRNLQNGIHFIKEVNRVKCSKFALFFLCMIYSPICFKNFKDPILPCRSICEHVKQNCGRYITDEWPEELKCEGLPEYSSGLCVSPNSFFLNTDKSTKLHLKKKRPNKKAKKCKCEERRSQRARKVKFRSFKKADFVIEASVMARETNAHGRTKVLVNVTNVIKQGNVRIKKGKTKLWAPTTCLCPQLQYNKDVYIIGNESNNRKRLTYDKKILVLPIMDWKNNIKKWAEKCRKKTDCVI